MFLSYIMSCIFIVKRLEMFCKALYKYGFIIINIHTFQNSAIPFSRLPNFGWTITQIAAFVNCNDFQPVLLLETSPPAFAINIVYPDDYRPHLGDEVSFLCQVGSPQLPSPLWTAPNGQQIAQRTSSKWAWNRYLELEVSIYGAGPKLRSCWF